MVWSRRCLITRTAPCSPRTPATFTAPGKIRWHWLPYWFTGCKLQHHIHYNIDRRLGYNSLHWVTFFWIQRATDRIQPEDRVLPGPAQSLRQGAVKFSDYFDNIYLLFAGDEVPAQVLQQGAWICRGSEGAWGPGWLYLKLYDHLMLSNRHTIMSNYISYHLFQDLELAKEMAEEDDDAY